MVDMKETAGILAVQGAFIEHERMLQRLGIHCIELRKASDLNQPFDRLVLPGGESTVQSKLLRELGMFDTLQAYIQNGMPVLGTCAGLILLAEAAEREPGVKDNRVQGFATLPVTVTRNAYGRQLGSFHAQEPFGTLGRVPMTFIRAPYVREAAAEGVQVLARVQDRIVAVRYGSQLGIAFHPELDEDLSIHEFFLKF